MSSSCLPGLIRGGFSLQASRAVFKRLSPARFCRPLFLCCALLSCFALLTGCGGGGGDDDFAGAGNVFISVTPSRIDVGDQTRARVRIRNINENGVLVKIRFPRGLRYVPASGKLLPEGADEINFPPDVNTRDQKGLGYLVFFLNEAQLDDVRSAEVIAAFEGANKIDNGRIEVDLDVDDLEIPNSVEFDIEDPKFQSEDESRIDVVS